MGVALHVFIVDQGKIKVEHTFYGQTEAEAETYRKHHLAICPYFRENEEADNVIEELEENVDAPTPDDFEEIEEEEEEES